MSELKDFVITSEMGERNWLAEDAEHAIEQHNDAFGEDDYETILSVGEVTDSGIVLYDLERRKGLDCE